MWDCVQSALTYLRRRFVFPTDESPMTATFAIASQSFFCIISILISFDIDMGSQSTSHSPLMQIVNVLFLMLITVTTVEGQADCTAKNLPAVIPLPQGERLIIDLQDYFEGSNLSFVVQPRVSWADVERQWQCESLGWPGNGGKVVASRWLQQQHILASLGESITGRYTLILTQTDSSTISRVDIPANISRCSDFLLTSVNKTHLNLKVSCLDNSRSFASLLLSTTIRIFDPQYIRWSYLSSPLFTYTPIINTKILMKDDNLLLRAVISSSNSYVELWSWEEEYQEILGVIDKTWLNMNMFDLRAIQLEGNVLIMLNYYFGLHVVRITESRTVELLSAIPEPFFDTFTYHPHDGTLLLGKKGKVVSAKVNNLETGTMTIGMSFNLFNYKSVRLAEVVNDKLIVLDESLINIFTIKANQNAYRHYSFYPAMGTTHFFIQKIDGQMPKVLLARSNNYQVEHLVCSLGSSFLRLSTPDSSQKVQITGKSLVNGQSSTCLQEFTLQPRRPTKQLIYQNGYSADKEILFANLPGQGVISLSKYGLGKNLNYSVQSTASTKIDYTVAIRKQNKVPCNIQNRNISRNSKFYYTATWLNLLIVQLSQDYELRYFSCLVGEAPSCTYALEVPNMRPVDESAYALQEETAAYSISWEALLQEVGKDLNVLVRRLIVQKETNSLQVAAYCTIKIEKFLENYQNITQLQISNGKLYILMAYIKQIRIYDLSDRQCPNIATVNKASFEKQQYFSPREIHFDDSYTLNRQPVIFIKQWNQLLGIRLTGRYYRPVIINKNTLPQSQNGTVLLSLPYVLYLSFNQNTVEINRLETNQKLSLLRVITLAQGYRFAYQGSDKKNCYQLLGQHHLSLRVVDEKTDKYEVKIYAFEELISAAQQYSSIAVSGEGSVHTYFQLESQSHHTLMMLDLVPGPSTSFLVCSAHDLHLSPSILFNFTSIRSTIESYSQNITLHLSTFDDSRTHNFQVSLTNLGESISRGNGFPGRGTSIQPASEIVLDDSYWFWGSIYDYDFDCRNCKDRIIFHEKITSESKEELPFTSEQFFVLEDEQQLLATARDYLIHMQYNYSVWPYQRAGDSGYEVKSITPLSIGGAECIDSVVLPERYLIISLCKRITVEEQEQKYYLSLVSTASRKTFIIAESQLNLQGENPPKLRFKNNILVVYSADMALLMTIWDVQGTLQLVQLDQIDRQDIADRICSTQLISNASSLLTPITQVLYTLAVTQCSNQLYYTSFSIYLEQQTVIDEEGNKVMFSVPSIHVSYGQNINLLHVWSQKGIEIPSDANIVQTITRQLQSPIQTDELLTLLVLFDRFHSYQFRLTISKQNKVIKAITLDSVFYKFGSNIATSAQLEEYLVIKYVLDVGFGKLGELYGCFDLNNYVVGSDFVKQHHHFSTYTFKNYKEVGQSQEDFPWYLDGHRIFQLHHQHLQILNISSKLRATILGLEDQDSSPLYTQKIIISANNPTSARSATIVLQSIDEFILTDIQLTLIVIGSLILLCVLIIVGRIMLRKLKKRLKLVPLASTSDVEDAELGWEERERSGEWRVNLTERGSVEPQS